MPVAARYSSADQLVCELPAWPYAETVTSVSILNLDTGSVLPPHPADETFFLNFRGAFREAPVHACLHPLRVSVPAKVGGVLRMQRDANVHPPPAPALWNRVVAASLSSLSPTRGDAVGGSLITVAGAGFSSSRYDYSCKFTCGDQLSVTSAQVSPVSGQALVCTTPAWPGDTCKTTVELFKAASRLVGSALFHYSTVWMAVSPTLGPNGGGTAIQMTGAGFNSSAAYTCIFEGEDPNTRAAVRVTSGATYSSPESVMCVSPQWPVTPPAYARMILEADSVEVKLQAAADILFAFSEGGWSSASPVTAPAAMPFNMSVAGQNFLASGLYELRLDAENRLLTSTKCAVRSQFTLLCSFPSWPYAEGATQVRLYNKDVPVGKTGGPLTFVFQPSWSDMSDYSGSVAGGKTLTISGNGFDVSRTDYYQCRFSGVDRLGSAVSLESAADAPSASRLTCRVPNWDGRAEQPVTVSLLRAGHAVPFVGSANSDRFMYISSWVRFRTLPSMGDTYGAWKNVEEDNLPYRSLSAMGGTQITISGSGFNASLQHSCRFLGVATTLDVPAQVVDDSRFLTCTSPAYPGPLVAGIPDFEGSHISIRFLLAMVYEGQFYNMSHLGEPFMVYMTKASIDLPAALEASGSPVGGTEITITGNEFCYEKEGEDTSTWLSSCNSKFVCQFTQISGSGSISVRSQSCDGGYSAGALCLRDSDCPGGRCSEIITRNGISRSRIIDGQRIVCATPPWPASGAKTMIQLLDVTTVADGIQVALMSAPGFFEYSYSVLSVQPYKVAASQSHRLTVTGTDFSTADQYYCKVTLYGRSKQSALVSPVSDTTLVCVIPGKMNAMHIFASCDSH